MAPTVIHCLMLLPANADLTLASDTWTSADPSGDSSLCAWASSNPVDHPPIGGDRLGHHGISPRDQEWGSGTALPRARMGRPRPQEALYHEAGSGIASNESQRNHTAHRDVVDDELELQHNR